MLGCPADGDVRLGDMNDEEAIDHVYQQCGKLQKECRPGVSCPGYRLEEDVRRHGKQVGAAQHQEGRDRGFDYLGDVRVYPQDSMWEDSDHYDHHGDCSIAELEYPCHQAFHRVRMAVPDDVADQGTAGRGKGCKHHPDQSGHIPDYI